jgi:hypothetical protein
LALLRCLRDADRNVKAAVQCRQCQARCCSQPAAKWVAGRLRRLGDLDVALQQAGADGDCRQAGRERGGQGPAGANATATPFCMMPRQSINQRAEGRRRPPGAVTLTGVLAAMNTLPPPPAELAPPGMTGWLASCCCPVAPGTMMMGGCCGACAVALRAGGRASVFA